MASRLHSLRPDLSIAVFERGPNEIEHPYVVNPQAAPLLAQTELVVNYKTKPQPQLNGRSLTNFAGRLLSGSSAANYGCWMRAPAGEYDFWAKQLGDSRWSYQNLLPYFRRSEHHHDSEGDREQHGFDGPIYTTSRRVYPLGDSVHQAFVHDGFHDIPDSSAGVGISPWVENWKDGSRQHSGKVFDLSSIQVITGVVVTRVVFNKKVATGIELSDGRHFRATREIVVSCGAHKTPQILMLSGIGPFNELKRHNIQQIVNSPTVGSNHFDHLSLHQAWKLRNPERGLAMGSPAFSKPEYSLGFPVEWLATYSVPTPIISAALYEASPTQPSSTPSKSTHFLNRSHIGFIVAYAPMNLGERYDVPLDGSHISTGVLLFQPTSRGSVTLASDDPTAEPIVDPGYYSTLADKEMLRDGVRRIAQVMETPTAREIIEAETPPKDMPVLTSSSSDEDIDARIRAYSEVWHHSGGTAAMGKEIQSSVVDGEFRVHGTDHLRVVDASVFPGPISATPQATVYAMAELAAELIAQSVP